MSDHYAKPLLGPNRQVIQSAGVQGFTRRYGLEDTFALRLHDIFVRIYVLEPDNYVENERQVKEQFELVAQQSSNAAVRMQGLQKALLSLQETVAALEACQAGYTIEEEPDLREMLWTS